MTETQKPLLGFRVLDLTNVLAGPFCCHQLAHLGAEVIKVEAVGRGDLARNLGADPLLNERGMGVSFLAQNAGKKSVTLNLKHDAGKDLLKRLVKTADVLVENFRPGVMERLDLGYDVLSSVKPDLIYCAISGFGQDGPWIQRPAYDQIIQGLSGLMSITGDDETAPLRVGCPIADTVGGMTAAFAIAAALNAEKRGAFLDVSMLESLLATMGWAISNYLIAGIEPKAHGNENVTSAPSGSFRTKDGLINIAANKDEQWTLLAQHLGRADLLDEPRFETREDRKANRLALKDELERTLMARPAAIWVVELNQLGVPAGEVLTVPDILTIPQIADRGFVGHFSDTVGVDRPVSMVRTGVKIDGQTPSVSTPPPTLGEHNDAIWNALGIEMEELERLRKAGTI
ncbi:MAG: CaiB/BaiF CoA transferase family protein [Geminicoccales bacterium]